MTQPVTLLAGGASPAGRAVAEELLGHGITPLIVSRSVASTDGPSSAGVLALAADLTDAAQVAALRDELAHLDMRVSAIVHLVGGWAGGKGIAGQTDDKYALLANSFHALRIVTREFHDDLLGSPAPRVIAVSSPLAQHPTPGSANYASVKAATEAWTLALDASLSASTPDGCASIIVTDSLAGRESTFATLVASVLEAPRDRVAGRRVLHV